MSRIELPAEESWQEAPVRFPMKGYLLSIGVILITTSLGLGFALLSLFDESPLAVVHSNSELQVLQVPDSLEQLEEPSVIPQVKVTSEDSPILSAAFYVEESDEPQAKNHQNSPVRLTGNIELLD